MNRIRLYAGDALLRAAQLLATAGRRILGSPSTYVCGDHPAGSREIVLDSPAPRGITRGVKLLRGDDVEIRRVVAVRGHRLILDAPTVFPYPNGAEARPLI